MLPVEAATSEVEMRCDRVPSLAQSPRRRQGGVQRLRGRQAPCVVWWSVDSFHLSRTLETPNREPEAVPNADHFLFPDFLIPHRRFAGHQAWLQIRGVWTPEYLTEKLASVLRDAQTRHARSRWCEPQIAQRLTKPIAGRF